MTNSEIFEAVASRKMTPEEGARLMAEADRLAQKSFRRFEACLYVVFFSGMLGLIIAHLLGWIR